MTTRINILKRIALFAFPAILLLSSGCKKFLNVNQDPNHLVAAQPDQLLPTVQAAIGVALGDDLYPYGNIWSQYFTQSAVASQYKTIDQYLQVNADFNYAWQHLYQSALINTQLMITNSTGNAALTQYLAIGDVLKAYSLQLATDAFGDIPVSQALQGSDNKNPSYDPQATVYDSIFALIEKGKALMSDTDPNAPTSPDLIFQGDMDSWIAFANTLELRAYLRLSQIDPARAEAGVKALYASNASFLNANAEMTYTSTGGNQNPFYIKEVALGKTVNLAASKTVVDAFVRNNDPRQFAVFTLLDSTDTVTYLPQGSFAQNINTITSTPSPLVAGDPQNAKSALAPVILISAAESNFLQAEAVSRGWASGSASTLFTQGIKASFASDGIPDSAAAYIASAPDAQFPAGAADQLKVIITQKYYAMCGSQGFEAWTEWRRTGYPDFLVTSAAAGGRTFPLRFLYPQSELTGNLKYPGTVPETTPVWWDK
ncbi:SusD/RagB family nutrient-binding outer membrane lipoprotein [Puia sp.]|uniref:SusD/RagB family nutrient-binding outer membrane lipoprotein n=1 Tax=Puia sp. TaxID=2045100 RepID=UPI002F401A35